MGGGAKKVGLEVDLGTGEAKRGLQELDAQIKSLQKQEEKSADLWKSWGANARRGILELSRDATKSVQNVPTTMARGIVGGVLAEVSKQGVAFRDALMAPATTSYQAAIEASKSFRKESQTTAVAIGRDYRHVQDQVNRVAAVTGEVPESILGWSRSLRAAGADWDSAVGSVEILKDYAAQTGQTLADVNPIAEQLVDQFGGEGLNKMGQFFGMLDAYAKRAGVSTSVLQQQVANLMRTYGIRIGGSAAGQEKVVMAIQSRFDQAFPGRPDVAADVGNQAFGVITQFRQSIERRMRHAGVLGRRESTKDAFGLLRPEMIPRMLQFAYPAIREHYHNKGLSELQDIAERTGLGSTTLITGLKALSEQGIDDLAPTPRGRGLAALRGQSSFQRTVSEIEKTRRDREEVGDWMLNVQDANVSGGGGKKGLLETNKAVSTVQTAKTVGLTLAKSIMGGSEAEFADVLNKESGAISTEDKLRAASERRKARSQLFDFGSTDSSSAPGGGISVNATLSNASTSALERAVQAGAKAGVEAALTNSSSGSLPTQPGLER